MIAAILARPAVVFITGMVSAPLIKPLVRGITKGTIRVAMEAKKLAAEAAVEVKGLAAEANAEAAATPGTQAATVAPASAKAAVKP